MSQKQTKKQRKFMRKQYGKLIGEMAEANNRFLKPKPRWVPMFLWIRLLRIFIKIN